MEKKKRNIIIILFVVVLVLTLILTIILYILQKQTEYQRQINLGEKYLSVLDYESAEICFKKAIRIDEKEIYPYIQLSNTYIKQQKYADAYKIMNKAQHITEQNYLSDDLDRVLSQIDYIAEEEKMQEQKLQEKLKSKDSKDQNATNHLVDESKESADEITQLIDYIDLPLSKIWKKYGKDCAYGDFLYYGGIRPVYYENKVGVPVLGIRDRQLSDVSAYTGQEKIEFVQFVNANEKEPGKMMVMDSLLSAFTFRELLEYDSSLVVQEDSDAVDMLSCFLKVQHNGEDCFITYYWPQNTDYYSSPAEYVEILKPWKNEGERESKTDYYTHLSELESQEADALANSQQDTAGLRKTYQQIYEWWDIELNYVYQELKKSLSEKEFQILRQEELQWIKMRDQVSQAAMDEFKSDDGTYGTAGPLAYIETQGRKTKERVYELTKMWIGY